jgi:hypothetical protein
MVELIALQAKQLSPLWATKVLLTSQSLSTIWPHPQSSMSTQKQSNKCTRQLLQARRWTRNSPSQILCQASKQAP